MSDLFRWRDVAFFGGYSSPLVGLYLSDRWERAPIGLFSRAGEEEPSEVGSREFGSIKHLEEHRPGILQETRSRTGFASLPDSDQQRTAQSDGNR